MWGIIYLISLVLLTALSFAVYKSKIAFNIVVGIMFLLAGPGGLLMLCYSIYQVFEKGDLLYLVSLIVIGGVAITLMILSDLYKSGKCR